MEDPTGSRCTSLYFCHALPRMPMAVLWKLFSWGEKSGNFSINGLWLDQSVENRLHKWGGKSPTAKVYTIPIMQWSLLLLNRIFYIFVASFTVCHHLILGRKNQAWCVYRSLTCGSFGWTSRVSEPSHRTTWSERSTLDCTMFMALHTFDGILVEVKRW